MSDIYVLSKRVTNENYLDEPKDKRTLRLPIGLCRSTPVTLFKLYNVLIWVHVVAWRDMRCDYVMSGVFNMLVSRPRSSI